MSSFLWFTLLTLLLSSMNTCRTPSMKSLCQWPSLSHPSLMFPEYPVHFCPFTPFCDVWFWVYLLYLTVRFSRAGTTLIHICYSTWNTAGEQDTRAHAFFTWVLKVTHRWELLLLFYKQRNWVQRGFYRLPKATSSDVLAPRLDFHWTTLWSVNYIYSVKKIKEKVLVLWCRIM